MYTYNYLPWECEAPMSIVTETKSPMPTECRSMIELGCLAEIIINVTAENANIYYFCITCLLKDRVPHAHNFKSRSYHALTLWAF